MIQSPVPPYPPPPMVWSEIRQPETIIFLRFFKLSQRNFFRGLQILEIQRSGPETVNATAATEEMH